jgi:cytochrome c5
VVNLLKVIIQRLRLLVLLIISSFLMGCDTKDSSSDSYLDNEARGLTGSDSLAQSGKAIYVSKCRGCHDYGVAGAPRYGSSEIWAERLTKGLDVLYKNSINGIRAMPARGGCYACSDDDIKAAVDYILANSQ